MHISREQGDMLLGVARDTARAALNAVPQEATFKEQPSIPGRSGGVFVTFWNGRRLRGCVGTFGSTTDLAGTTRDVTRSSLADPRFEGDPVTTEELPLLTIEISVLSDLVPATSPASIIPGTHGILIRCGHRSGCFLPKVAVERGWSAEEFLANCCTMKAGLDADAWRRPGTEVLTFTATVFSE